jgi:hypothetical protein
MLDSRAVYGLLVAAASIDAVQQAHGNVNGDRNVTARGANWHHMTFSLGLRAVLATQVAGVNHKNSARHHRIPQ